MLMQFVRAESSESLTMESTLREKWFYLKKIPDLSQQSILNHIMFSDCLTMGRFYQ